MNTLEIPGRGIKIDIPATYDEMTGRQVVHIMQCLAKHRAGLMSIDEFRVRVLYKLCGIRRTLRSAIRTADAGAARTTGRTGRSPLRSTSRRHSGKNIRRLSDPVRLRAQLLAFGAHRLAKALRPGGGSAGYFVRRVPRGIGRNAALSANQRRPSSRPDARMSLPAGRAAASSPTRPIRSTGTPAYATVSSHGRNSSCCSGSPHA